MQRSPLLPCSLFLAALALAACASRPPTASVTPPADGAASSAAWTTYTSADLGFSMDLPQAVYVASGAALSPVVAVEDAANKRVFLTAREYYVYPDVTHPHAATVGTLTDKDVANDPPFWEFKAVEVKDEAAIDQFLQKEFGATCHVGQKNPTVQEGVWDIVLAGDDKGLDETNCPVNAATFFRFAPASHRLVYTVLGQDIRFLQNPSGDGESYDLEMIQSFRMLP